MPDGKYPVVDESASLGEAARAATQAGVGAVLLDRGAGQSIVDVSIGLHDPDATVGQAAERFGIAFGEGGTADPSDLPDFERFDQPAGYKECSVNSSHVYAPNYPGSTCPMSDGGTLMLVML